jgi:glycine/D-amino acid oxidase-like deaminating enzyme
MSSVLADGFRPTSFWWQEESQPKVTAGPLPAQADVVVIGSGYTGLTAALGLARAGRDVVVLDAERLGFGCSTRNGGQIGPAIRIAFQDLTACYGKERAYAIKREGFAAYDYLTNFITAEGIDCDIVRSGHLRAAHTPRAYRRLESLVAGEPPEFEDSYLIPKSEMRSEIGSDVFHGGLLYPESGALDPGKYHTGLAARAMAAGARMFENRKVVGVQGGAGKFEVHLETDKILARDVVLATNGYTGTATPWWRRRVIPIGSYIIATEPMDPALMRRLIPNLRMLNETRKVVYYYRPSPDGRRMLFGGRVAITETNPLVSAPRLHAAMTRVFPELQSIKVSHSWMGFVAFTFDELPHTGQQDGVHYAMGCCGNGIALSTYFGRKMADRILGKPEGMTALQSYKFQTRPLYYGKPWFLAPSLLYYQMKDRMIG